MQQATTAIPISKPLFGEEELNAVQRPIESGWVVQGPEVARFEEAIADFTGARHAVATSSCTTALHIAVASLGATRGDEVVVPAFTWISTANVVELQGAKAVFCDIDLDTFNASADSFRERVGERTVGLIPVHLFGLCAEMEPILEVARERGLWTIEDAACALGGTYGGGHAGTLGDVGCFSFHPRKSITTGEGGLITTANDELADLARSLRDHGASRSDFDRHESADAFLLSSYRNLGFNYRMTDIQGALGVAQMQRLEWILERRRTLAAAYDDALAHLEWLRTPRVPDGYVHGYQAYVCLYAPEEPSLGNLARLHERRNRVMADLEAQGIATRQGTHAPVASELYAARGVRAEEFPNALIADRLTLALPLYPQLTDEEQARVVDALRAAGDA